MRSHSFGRGFFSRNARIPGPLERMTREEALKVMEESRLALPEGYKFDREDANAR